MSHVVGRKGQIVIEKEIRERLGIEPGWRALQLLVGDHLEIHFVPPEHNRSLANSLARYVTRSLPTAEALAEARALAWTEAVNERMIPRDQGPE